LRKRKRKGLKRLQIPNKEEEFLSLTSQLFKWHTSPTSYNVVSYRGKGTTKEVKRLRKIDTRPQQMGAIDYQFDTPFQKDLYETVIILRRRIVSEAQWVNWSHMAEQHNPIFNQVIAACESFHIKRLMRFYYDWNIEVIAQFYAKLFIEETENVRAMHWLTEGDWYNITFDEFATQFSYGEPDKDHFRIHIHNPLDENEMKFMYARDKKAMQRPSMDHTYFIQS
jgi:hypothetical protein